MKNGKDSYDADVEVTKYIRKYEYLGEVLTGRESAEERTLFGYTDKINEKWEEQYEIARKKEFKTDLKNMTRTRARSILTTFVSIAILIILLKPVEMGLLTIGLFISIANGVLELGQMMSWQFSYYISELAKNKEYMKDLFDFFNLQEKEGALDKPCDKLIFKHYNIGEMVDYQDMNFYQNKKYLQVPLCVHKSMYFFSNTLIIFMAIIIKGHKLTIIIKNTRLRPV